MVTAALVSATRMSPSTVSAARMTATAVISGKSVFRTCTVVRVAGVSLPIPSFVSMEVVELLGAACRQRTSVAMARIIPVVDVAIKSVRAVEPRAGSNKYAANEPVWSIVAVGSTVVRGVIKIPIRAYGRHSDIDGNLSRRGGCVTK